MPESKRCKMRVHNFWAPNSHCHKQCPQGIPVRVRWFRNDDGWMVEEFGHDAGRLVDTEWLGECLRVRTNSDERQERRPWQTHRGGLGQDLLQPGPGSRLLRKRFVVRIQEKVRV